MSERKIETLTKETLESRFADFIALEPNWTELGESAWEKNNFLLDLPGKWDLSVYATQDGKLAGYAIGSLNNSDSPKVAKLNKILVDERFRSLGIASELWNTFLINSKAQGVHEIRFRALPENTSANKFYRKHSCTIVGQTVGEDSKTRNDFLYVLSAPDKIRHSLPEIGQGEFQNIATTLLSKNLATGSLKREFENQFAEFLGMNHALATSSGSAALFLGLRALNIGQGDSVIVPSYICSSVPQAVINTGAQPIFVDINSKDYNISLDCTRKKVNQGTKAIIIPHMFGKPVMDFEDFTKLGIPIIEDIAHSPGAEHNDRKIGTKGVLSVASFYATKMITTGVGGMIFTSDERINSRLRDLMKYDSRSNPGENYNFEMSDLQASLGIAQLKRLPDFIKQRRELAKVYGSLLAQSQFEFTSPQSDSENIFFRYLVKTNNPDLFIKNLQARNIEVRKPIFQPAHSYFKEGGDFPNTENAFATTLSLPIYPGLRTEDAQRVVSALINAR